MRESIVNKLPGGDLINKIKTQISKSLITGRLKEGVVGLNHLHNFYRWFDKLEFFFFARTFHDFEVIW